MWMLCFVIASHPDGATDPVLGFIRPEREAEMRAAYPEFARRLGL